jgi:hypothetical protein
MANCIVVARTAARRAENVRLLISILNLMADETKNQIKDRKSKTKRKKKRKGRKE